VDARVWDQVGLELGNVDVQGTIEAEGGGQRRDDLGLETVEVGVSWALDVETATADVVQGLVVKHDGNVGVLKERVGRQGSIVWLDNSSRHLGRWVDAESELGLLAIVHRQALEEQSTEARASTTTNRVEDEEALETSALIGELAEAVEGEVNNLFANGVMATGIVVGCVLLAGDQLLWVVELAVGTSTDLVDHGRLQIEVDAARYVLAGASLGEEGVERVVTTTNGLVGWHLAIRLNAVLEAVKLPTSVTGLATALADMD